MNGRNEYEFDVMISWTGKDRELKNAIREALEAAGLTVYDSERDCVGRFRDDYTRAIGASKVFLALMSDNLRNDPNVGGEGTFSEVRKEYDLALDADAHGVLNIQIFNISPVFRSLSVWNIPFDDVIGRYFAAFASANGLSRVDAAPVNGAVPQDKIAELVEKVKTLVQKRDAGSPVPSQYVHSEVAETEIYGCDTFVGREGEIEQIADAYRRGARAVVLCGMGGIGKSELAKHFALRCNGRNVAAVQFVSLPDTFLPPQNIERQLFAVLGAVEYVPSVVDRMAGKSERERLDIMCGALRNLPPHALIILDNVNFPYRGLLRRLLSFTKCLFLLTSRVVEKEEPAPAAPAGAEQTDLGKRLARLKEKLERVSGKLQRVDDSRIAVLPEVTKLPLAEAQELFVRESGRAVSGPEFYGLYRLVDGHTICLYLLARVLRANPQKKIAEIAEEFAENRMQERVRLLHNGNEQDATLLAHVDALFDLSLLDEACLRILRGMALLDDGRIAADELRAAFGLDNNNEINALCEGGWLREGGGALHMHPVLSRLAAWKLHPSAAEDGAVTDWLLQRAQNAEQRPVGTAIRLENSLWYALCVLARSERRLCRPLWERFTELSHRHAAQAEVRERAEELLPLLDGEDEREIVRSYADMVLLEQDPSRFDVLAQYLSKLESRAGDYKWVSRMLSVTLGRIAQNAEHREDAARVISAALDAAMRNEDDSAVFLLSLYALPFFGKRRWKKEMKEYLHARRRAGAQNGSLVYIEAMLAFIGILPKQCFEDVNALLNTSRSLIAALTGEELPEGAKPIPALQGIYEHPIRWALRHPLLLWRSSRFNKKIETVAEDENDPLQEFYLRVSELTENIALNDYIDLQLYYDAIVELAGHFRDEKLSLVDPQRAAAGAVSMLLGNLSPENRLFLLEYACPKEIDEETFSLQDLAVLDTYLLLCGTFPETDPARHKAELAARTEKLRMMRTLYAEDDYRVYGARLELAQFRLRTDSFAASCEYLEIWRDLVRRGGNADLLTRVGRELLFLSGKNIWMVTAGQGSPYFVRAEQELRGMAERLWDGAETFSARATALRGYLVQAKELCTAAQRSKDRKGELPPASLDWAEEKLHALVQEVSPAFSAQDVDWLLDVCDNLNFLLSKQPVSDGRRARVGKYLEERRAIETRAPKQKRAEIRVGRLFHEGQEAFAGGDLPRGCGMLGEGLKLACRKGVFRVGFLRNQREALLWMLLLYFHRRLSADAALPPLGWADGLLGRRARRRAQKMLDGAVGACAGNIMAMKTGLDEASVRAGIIRLSVSKFEEIAKQAFRSSRGTPFGMKAKAYRKCRSASRYTIAFLEYACQELAQTKFTIRRPDGGKQT